LGATLDHGAEAETQEIEFDTDGLYGGQLLICIAFSFDELRADRGRREAAIQPCGLEGGVGLEMISDQIAEILNEMGQVDLGGLAAPSGEVVPTRDAGVPFMLRLANGITRPTQLPFGLPLAQAEGFDRFRHETPAPGTVERLCRFLQQGTHSRRQIQLPPPGCRGGIIQNFSGRIIFP
jgi:hypothetical protein